MTPLQGCPQAFLLLAAQGGPISLEIGAHGVQAHLGQSCPTGAPLCIPPDAASSPETLATQLGPVQPWKGWLPDVF